MPQTQVVRGRATNVRIETNKDGHQILNVRYHQTDVVRYNFQTGTVTLDTGGHFSFTTKIRMTQAANQYNLDYRIYQKDFDWFVDVGEKTFEFTKEWITLDLRNVEELDVKI